MSEILSHAHPEADVYTKKEDGIITPALDINKIIQLVFDVANGEKTPETAAKEFVNPYRAFAEVFAKDKAMEMIEAGVGAAGIQSLSNRDFSENVVMISGTIADHVKLFMNHEISEEELILFIGNSGIKDVGMQVLSALGIHEKLGVENPAEIMKLAPAVMAFTASMAAYKELKKAMDDLALARAQRIQIEKECQESISMIRMYRTEMERIVSSYLTVRLETFESGFAAIDQALIEGDINGYIKGNTEIQQILGYNAQFSNQDEFDALMDSDESFKL